MNFHLASSLPFEFRVMCGWIQLQDWHFLYVWTLYLSLLLNYKQCSTLTAVDNFHIFDHKDMLICYPENWHLKFLHTYKCLSTTKTCGIGIMTFNKVICKMSVVATHIKLTCHRSRKPNSQRKKQNNSNKAEVTRQGVLSNIKLQAWVDRNVLPSAKKA